MNCAAIDCYNSDISPAKIFNILKALQIADTAWKKVDAMTIQNCWRKSSILPHKLLNLLFNEPAATPLLLVSSLLNMAKSMDTTADVKVEQALSHLERLRVLQHGNWMSINELLNLINEDRMHNVGTEEETKKDIYEAVVKHCNAKQNREMNSDYIEVINKKPS